MSCPPSRTFLNLFKKVKKSKILQLKLFLETSDNLQTMIETKVVLPVFRPTSEMTPFFVEHCQKT